MVWLALQRFVERTISPIRFEAEMYARVEDLERSLARPVTLAILACNFQDPSSVERLRETVSKSVPPWPAPTPPTSGDALLSSLEAQISNSPNEPEPYLIYADALAERGDPLGEWIALSMQHAERGSFVLHQALVSFRETRGTSILYGKDVSGPISWSDVTPQVDLHWFMGFICAATIRNPDAATVKPGYDRKDLLEVLFQAPVSRLLRRVQVHSGWGHGAARDLMSIPSSVTDLRLFGDHGYIDHGRVDLLFQRTPNLRNLSIVGDMARPESFPAGLVTLEIVANAMPTDWLTQSFAELERLRIIEDERGDPALNPEADLAPVFSGEFAPKLRCLDLETGALSAHSLLDLVLGSAIAPQLEQIAVYGGRDPIGIVERIEAVLPRLPSLEVAEVGGLYTMHPARVRLRVALAARLRRRPNPIG